MLSKLIIDLATDPNLVAELQQDPRAVIQEYNLDSRQTDLLRSGNVHEIAWAALKEIIKMVEDLSKIIVFGWAAGRAHINTFSPGAADLATEVSGTIAGDFFPPEADMEVSFVSDNDTVAATVVSVADPELNGSTATINVTFANAGTYSVVMTDTRDKYTANLADAIVVSVMQQRLKLQPTNQTLIDTRSISAWLDADLVTTEQRTRVDAIVNALPSAFRLGVLECRLDGDPQVDFLAGVTNHDGGLEGIARSLPNQCFTSLFDTQDFLQEWSNGNLNADIPLIWYEYDLPNEQPVLREPLVGIGLSPRHFNLSAAKATSAQTCGTAINALAHLHGKPPDEDVMLLVEQCVEALPESAAPLYIASLAPRGLVTTRLVIEINPHQAPTWLKSICHPRATDGAVTQFIQCWDRVGIQIEINSNGIGDYIAYELYPAQKLQQAQEKSIASLARLDSVAAHRLQASMAWQGFGRYEAGDWPIDVNRNTVLKLIPRDQLEVKSYLCYHSAYSFWKR